MSSQKEFILEVCQENDIEVQGFSSDYVLRLTKNGISRNIFGAFWDINSAASDRIACDKTATFELLNTSGVPAIEHVLFNNPLTRLVWAKPEGAWASALRIFHAFNDLVVLKPNQGTRGADVYFCDSIPKMEAAAHAIFATHSAAAISPYVKIQTEYRIFYLNEKCPFVYGKVAHETWQHNLAMGAKAIEFIIKSKEDKQLLADLKDLAHKAAKCIGINFATIDIAQTESGGLYIMEINSGVQARLLLGQHPHLRDVIKRIYYSAILQMF